MSGPSPLRYDPSHINPMAVTLNVEHDSPSRFLKSRILERAGFEVVEAVTAADAVRTASEDALRLVLLDLRLPDGDGFSVCEQIKSTRPLLPVVMMAFFAGERHQVFGDIARALDGHVAQREAQIRPRDRRPFTLAYEICREPAIGASAVPRLRWTLEPIKSDTPH
jgi:CheY-like chemotaxis protein